jgi:hypothetical protein
MIYVTSHVLKRSRMACLIDLLLAVAFDLAWNARRTPILQHIPVKYFPYILRNISPKPY